MKQEKLLSRRKMLFGGAAILAAPTLLLKAATPKSAANAFQQADRKLSLTSGADPGFSAELDSLFPGLSADPVFQKIKPLAILVTHHAGPSVRALTALWTITLPAGTYQTSLFCYSHAGMRSQKRPAKTLASGQREVLKANQSRLVTPFFTWSPRQYAKNPSPDWNSLLDQSDVGPFLASQLDTATEVTAELDGVVFSDRKLLGPDTQNLTKRLTVRRNAEHDEALSILKKVKAGASAQDIENVLIAHATAMRASTVADIKGVYLQARRHHAQILLKIFENKTLAGFTKVLHKMTKLHKTNIAAANV